MVNLKTLASEGVAQVNHEAHFVANLETATTAPFRVGSSRRPLNHCLKPLYLDMF
jgi:hypothetical protein